MSKLFFMIGMAVLMMAFDGHSQALRFVGYEGELVFVDVSIEPITVRGATKRDCINNFETQRAGRDLYYGTRNGTQKCIPIPVYRSPTAPSYADNSAVKVWPRIPEPPVCISCFIFDSPQVIAELYPNHSHIVMDYVKNFGVDKYNQELQDLNGQYSQQLEAFERKIMQLDDYLEIKGK